LYPIVINASAPVAAQLSSVPRVGIGYGVLRYLADAGIRERLAKMPSPDVAFNYLGRFDTVLSPKAPFRLTTESTEPNWAPGTPAAHPLEVHAVVREGRLEVRCDYTGFSRATIERLMDGFMSRLRARSAGFPALDLSAETLAELESLARAAGACGESDANHDQIVPHGPQKHMAAKQAGPDPARVKSEELPLQDRRGRVG
jgi:non-ribosomal peptide synthase protein (TIGR01720 family)